MSRFDQSKTTAFKEAFEIFDLKGDGQISTEHTGLIVRAVGQNPTEAEVEVYKGRLDPSKKGSFDWDTFINFLDEIWNDADISAQITEAFHVFDEDGSGAISAVELKHVMTNLGEKLTDKEIDDIFCEGDVDGDGQIDYDEFMKMMQH